MALTGLLVSLLVAAGEPPLAEDAPVAQPPALQEAPRPSCWQLSTNQHYGMQGYYPGMYVEPRVAAPPLPYGSTSAQSSANSPLSGTGAGLGKVSGEALLALAVVAVAAAPIVVYALDSQPDADVLLRYRCPEVDVSLVGGAVSLPSDPSRFAPVGGVRTSFSMGPLGVDANYESTANLSEFGNLDVHLRLRPPPKKHIEGAVAVGYRRAVFGGAQRDGFEVGLPHHYVLTRMGVRPLTIDLHPAVFIGARGPDFRLEGGLSIPAGIAVIRLGGRVFSFDEHVRAGAYLGLGLWL